MSVQPAEMTPLAFSVAEVADLLGCSADTVRRLIAAGLFDAVQPLGKGGRDFVGRRAVESFFGRLGALPVAAVRAAAPADDELVGATSGS